MSIIFWWLEINRKVARYFIEKGLFKLLSHFLLGLIVECTVWLHVIREHEMSQIETDQ